jgi:hypothetical protein
MFENRKGLLVNSALFVPGSKHFTFQTAWMAEQFLARNHKNKVYQGGLLSNVTYRFLKNGYSLLSTSMFCEELSRWIPVQLSWIRSLRENYYKVHFAQLFCQTMIPAITLSECKTLARQVVDFSMAQKEGFVNAYMEVFSEVERTQAMTKLKGCHEHYRAQVNRIKRNRAIIPAHEEV